LLVPYLKTQLFYAQTKRIFAGAPSYYLPPKYLQTLGVGNTSFVGIEPIIERLGGCNSELLRTFNKDYMNLVCRTKGSDYFNLGIQCPKPEVISLLPIELAPGVVVGFYVLGEKKVRRYVMHKHRKDPDLSIYLTYNSSHRDFLVKDLGQAVDIVKQSMYQTLRYNIVFKPDAEWTDTAGRIRMSEGVLKVQHCPYQEEGRPE
jgi:hypothetical protein